MIWLTGLSGSGKSTIAHHVCALLLEDGQRAVHLDGDAVRACLPAFGHTLQERRSAAWIYARLAALLSGQGHTVVCSTISLFHEVQCWNRGASNPYLEVLVTARTETLLARDHRGVYRGPTPAVGDGQPAEFPESPDLVLRNDDDCDPALNAARVSAAARALLARA